MEAEVVGNDSGGTSSTTAAAATAAVTGGTAKTNEPTCDMPTEITPTGIESQPPRPRFQYSTDLRKELSLDVLASLGGSAVDDAKAIEESVLDLASVQGDMEFISQLSSFDLDHNDSIATDTLLPSSAPPPHVERYHGADNTGVPPASEMILPGDDSSLLPSGPASVGSRPSLPLDELSPYVSLVSIVSSMSSEGGILVENADPLSSGSTVLSSISVAPTGILPASDMSYPASSTLSPVPSTADRFQVADALVEGEDFLALEQLPESDLAHPPASEPALASRVPVDPVSSLSTSPSTVGDVDPATVEPYYDSPKSLVTSPGPPLASDVAPLPPATAKPTDPTAWAGEYFLPTAVPGVSGDHVPNCSPANVELVLPEMPLSAPIDTDPTESSVPSFENSPSALETLLPAGLHSTSSPTTAENSPLAITASQYSFPAPADDAVLRDSVVSTFTTSPLLNNGNVSVASTSPAVDSHPVELAPLVTSIDVLDSATNSSTPLVPFAVSTTKPGVPPASLTPPLVPPKMVPLNNSTSVAPLARRFWDAPKSLSAEISLSVYFDGHGSALGGRKINRKRRTSETGSDGKDMKGKGLSDTEKVEEVAELESMLEAQKRMVKWQIDEIQRITTLQFQLTGSNPLSEEAIWDVLGVKGGGKKSGDSLSPEMLKCLQEIFAIKDTLTKKEARDISFTSGASLMQVREYFAAQRSLVRRLVQQAHDEAGRLEVKNASEQSQQIAVLNSVSEIEKDLGFDKLSGAESIEKILEAMRAEKGFAGQIQLLQLILRTDSAALILRRFLEKGGLKMLGGWLVEASREQQTSVICQLLKVLDHLPMSNAVSHQMPPLVQSVNKLRFHDASAVAGQARSLFSKWVKLFSPKTEVKTANAPGSKLASGAVTASGGLKRNRDRPVLQPVHGAKKKKVRTDEVLPQDTKASVTAVADSPSQNGMSQGASEQPSSTPQVPVPAPATQRWSSTVQPSESAVAAVSVSRKRLASKSLGDQSKERRKLLRVEDNHLGKSSNSKPSTFSKTSRPLSTDDIYKAKKLERLMQEPILKSRRKPVAAQEQSQVAQDVIPESGTPTKPTSPAVPRSDVGAVKGGTPSASPGSWRGGALTASQDHQQPTATRTQLPMRRPAEYHDVKTSITPTSSQDLLRMITPTSSQEICHPDFINGDTTEDMVFQTDSNLITRIEIDHLSTLVLGSSGFSQAATAVLVAGSLGLDSAAAVNTTSEDPMHPMQLLVSETKDMTTQDGKLKPAAVVENVRMPSASSEPSEARLEELSGLSVLRGVLNLADKSGMDVVGITDHTDIEQQELGKGAHAKASPRETSLNDFYAALRASMVRWRVPPEYHSDREWNVAAGEDSKERLVQSGRVKREEEAYYPELSAVPDDPKDPWEEEQNYDDSLTLEIFVDNGQRKVFTEANYPAAISKPPAIMNVAQYGPEAASIGSDGSSNTMQNSVQVPNSNHGQEPPAELFNKAVNPSANGIDLVLQQLSSGGGGAHDPDLLALLLRNPELVSQLTSGLAFTPPSGIANPPGVFMLQPPDPLKQQLSSGGNNGGAGLSNPALGDLGQEKLITSNNSKALGIPLQPGRSVSSMDQTPPETMRVQDSIPMMPHPGMGQQQTMGFVPQGGVVDNRFLPPQMPSAVARNIQHDTSGWEQQRRPPPPPLPPVPSTQQPVINQVLQPPLPNQPNKQSNWPDPQAWVAMGRPPPLNPPPQPRTGPDQLHTRQTLMTHNVRVPNYGGMLGVPQVEGGPDTSVVSQPEVQHSHRPWLNGSHSGPAAHDNNAVPMHSNQDSGASRNNRWARPPVRPDQHLPVRPGDQHLPVRPDQHLPVRPDQHLPVRPGDQHLPVRPDQHLPIRPGDKHLPVRPDQHLPVRPDQHLPGRPDQHLPVVRQEQQVAARPDQYSRSGGREFNDFSNGRQSSVVDNRSAWVANERARPILPPYQGAYTGPLPPQPYQAHVWQGQDSNIRLVQGGGHVNPFPQGRDLRPSQQQMWHNNMGSAASRQIWRGQQ